MPVISKNAVTCSELPGRVYFRRAGSSDIEPRGGVAVLLFLALARDSGCWSPGPLDFTYRRQTERAHFTSIVQGGRQGRRGGEEDRPYAGWQDGCGGARIEGFSGAHQERMLDAE